MELIRLIIENIQLCEYIWCKIYLCQDSSNIVLKLMKDKDGNISNVHTDKDNCAYMDYKGGK